MPVKVATGVTQILWPGLLLGVIVALFIDGSWWWPAGLAAAGVATIAGLTKLIMIWQEHADPAVIEAIKEDRSAIKGWMWVWGFGVMAGAWALAAALIVTVVDLAVEGL